MFYLLPQGRIAPERLAAKELSVIGVVESFHHAAAPGFIGRDESRGHMVMQTDAQHNPRRLGVAVGAPEAELIIDLKKQGMPIAFQHLMRIVAT